MNIEKQNKIFKVYGDFVEQYGDFLPDWFGGAFIEGEEAFLLVTGDADECGEKTDFFQNAGFEIKPAVYSYNALCSIKRQIVETLRNPREELNNCELAKRFAGCGICEPENVVHVIFEKLTETDQELFRRYVSDSEAVVLLEGGGLVNHISVSPSEMLQQGDFTMGYAAQKTDDSSKGFVTCGHIGMPVGDNLYKGATAVAEIVNIQFNQELDACYAKMIGGHSADNNVAIAAGTVISGVSTSYLVGASVVMYGGRGGEKHGRVTYCSYDCPRIDDVILCTYESQPGDSGSPVILYGTEEIIGINRGLVTIVDIDYGVSVKADKINRVFSLKITDKPVQD